MRQDPQSIATTSGKVVEYQGGQYGELVIVYNPSTNTNNVFLALNRDATTAAVTGQVTVAPGQYAFFILTQNDNAGGINGIAATGATVVTVLRQSFRSDAERLSVMGGLYGGAIAAQFWVAISGTQIQLSGSIVEARVNTLRTKTSGQSLLLQSDQGHATQGTLDLATGANGNALLTAAGSGNAAIESSDRTDFIAMSTSAYNVTRNNQQKVNLDDSTGYRLLNSTGFLLEAGSADVRVFSDTVGSVINTPAAGGNISSAHFAINVPIKSGSTIAVGDIVEWDPNNDNRVVSSAAGSTNGQLGVCITGGTGNAGGTVFARIAFRGVFVGFLADAAGVTAGQYGAQGATTANRLLSAATITPASFCRVLKTAAGGAAATVSLGLT